jgi:hypothetical protein
MTPLENSGREMFSSLAREFSQAIVLPGQIGRKNELLSFCCRYRFFRPWQVLYRSKSA